MRAESVNGQRLHRHAKIDEYVSPPASHSGQRIVGKIETYYNDILRDLDLFLATEPGSEASTKAMRRLKMNKQLRLNKNN
jgi:hypothetical protein